MLLVRPFHKLVSVSCYFSKNTLSNYLVITRNQHTKRRFPDLLYIPHIYQWLNTKLKFKYLRHMWDPEFNEGAFIYGTTGAICRITEVINSNEPNLLADLLTPKAEAKLRNVMSGKLSMLQKSVIRLLPADIKLLVPLRVQLINDRKTSKKSCLVLLKSLSMKWYEDSDVIKLVLIVLETEFKRDYGNGAKPEWTISAFDVVQCVLIGGNSRTTS